MVVLFPRGLLQAGHFHQMVELIGHDFGAAELLLERSLAEEGVKPDRIAPGEDFLPLSRMRRRVSASSTVIEELSMIDRM